VRVCLRVTMQTGAEGVGGRAGSGQIPAQRHASRPSTRPRVPAPSYELLAHHARLRHACHSRRHDSRAELYQRDDQERRPTPPSATTLPGRDAQPLQA